MDALLIRVNTGGLRKKIVKAGYYNIAEWIIRTFTNRGDLVLDCFMGVGTTGIACKKNNRDFIGFEKSEEYTKDANRNIEAGEVLR